MKKIVINIGHGGLGSKYDSGATGYDGTQEHKFNRDELFPLLKKALENKRLLVIEVIQERRFTELPDRINEINPDLIVSLHFNASDGTATGSEVLYWKTSKRSKLLAEKTLTAIVDSLGLANRGIKPLDFGSRGNVLCRLTNAPCVILEPFFGDNKKDLETARANIQKLANNLADAIADYAQELD